MRALFASLAVLSVLSPILAGQDPATPPASVQPTSQPAPELNEIFTEFAAAESQGDDAVDAVFRAHPYEVIFLVDRNLEGWLAEQEKPESERAADADRMLNRALYAAGRADHVFEVTAYSAYANAWKGWTPAQRVRFREGQKTFQDGSVALKAKRVDEGRAMFLAALAAATEVGDTWGIAQAEQRLGDLAFGAGDLAAAEAHMKRSLGIFAEMRHVGMLRSLRGLAALYEREGKPREALASLERMLEVAKEADRAEAAQQVRSDIARLRREAGLESENASRENKVATARSEMSTWRTAVTTYFTLHNRLPESLDVLKQPDPKFDDRPFASADPIDPWGNRYQFRKVSASAFEITCLGADGRPGGEGANADLVSG